MIRHKSIRPSLYREIKEPADFQQVLFFCRATHKNSNFGDNKGNSARNEQFVLIS